MSVFRYIVLGMSLLRFYSASSQELAQVSFSNGSAFTCFSLLTDREVLIRISPEGRILEWGIEVQSMYSGNIYAKQLQPFLGRVEYYGPEADSVSRGKLRSIGSSVITYYQGFESPELVGKIRTIGKLIFDYYGRYDQKMVQGKIRFIGNAAIEYYQGFDDPQLQGNLKTVGSTGIRYYSSFDDKAIRGKIKSIGNIQYSWYTSLDRPGYGGNLKSGPLRQNTGGVVYIIQ
mgnify:CR=1 FL=1